jgi:OmpA-OmpF porin, OOP family
MKLLSHIFLAVLFFNGAAISFAQSSNDDIFAPREMVIFSDDFSQDPVGAFPEQWEVVVRCNTRFYGNFSSKLAKVKKENGHRELEMKSSWFHLIPKEKLTTYLSDSFTLEYDFFLANTFASSDIILIPGERADSCPRYLGYYEYQVSVMQWGESRTWIKDDSLKLVSTSYPGIFDTTSWHHLGISYNRGEVKVYVDSFKIFAFPHCGVIPKNILIGGWATVKYRDIRIATGPEATPIRQLLKGKPLTTHAILFDVGSAAIKPESNKYLEELAALLQANPKLKLNINGHTDSDGSDAENLLLSEKRAMAVKDFLTLKGITESRLNTKGFGESKPLKRGFTADIKALNRRVEFVPR